MSQDTLTLALPSTTVMLPLGGERYGVAASVVDANAGRLVAQWFASNQPAPEGFKYVVVELTMTGIDDAGVEPSLAFFDLHLQAGRERYDSEYLVFGEHMPSVLAGSKLFPGESFTGYAAYLVPAAATSFKLYGNTTYVAL